jgi:hypothetical protein
MPATIEVDHENQLTIFRVTGEATFEEGLEVNKTFYAGNPTKNVVWAFSKARLHKITNEQFQKIVDSVKHLTGKRAGGKTVFLVSRDLEYGVSRMMGVFTEMNDSPLQTQVFKSMYEAIQWFNED